MPTYQFRCPKEHEFETFYSIDERNTKTRCPHCNRISERIISFRQKDPSFTEKLYGVGGYYDPNLETHITSPKHREQVMAAMDVREKHKDRRTTYAQEKYLMNHRYYKS